MSANTSPDNITYPTSTDSFGPLETQFATLATSVQTAFNNGKTYRTADHVSLAAISGAASGALATVIEGGAIFAFDGSAWQQKTYANFPTSGARDTAYAKAGGIYRVVGLAQVFRTDRGNAEYWNGTGWMPTVLTRTYSASYADAAYANLQAIGSIALPSIPVASRASIDIGGLIGFSGSSSVSYGLNLTTTAGGLADGSNNTGTFCVNASQWYYYGKVAYLDLAANTAATISISMSTASTAGHWKGNMTVSLSITGEY